MSNSTKLTGDKLYVCELIGWDKDDEYTKHFIEEFFLFDENDHIISINPILDNDNGIVSMVTSEHLCDVHEALNSSIDNMMTDPKAIKIKNMVNDYYSNMRVNFRTKYNYYELFLGSPYIYENEKGETVSYFYEKRFTKAVLDRFEDGFLKEKLIEAYNKQDNDLEPSPRFKLIYDDIYDWSKEPKEEHVDKKYKDLIQSMKALGLDIDNEKNRTL